MSMNRRDFLKVMIAGVGSMAAGPLVFMEDGNNPIVGGKAALRFDTSVGDLMFALPYTEIGNGFSFDSLSFEARETMTIYGASVWIPNLGIWVPLNIDVIVAPIASSLTVPAFPVTIESV